MKTDTQSENAIEIKNVSMKFGKHTAVSDLSFSVPKGSVMALLGENGAGKTTTLRILASIYDAASGEGTVLGSPLGDTSSVQYQKIGYVSENQKLPTHWTLARLLKYLRPLYPTWDEKFCQQLVEDFELPLDRKIKAMSRGMQMKVSLVSALSYRPELLLLDEPFSGLDPLIREEFIDGILELMDGGDWTILLSSHDIHEVERLCDSVTLIDHGSIVLSESLMDLQGRFRRWTVQISGEFPTAPAGWVLVEQLTDDSWTFVETKYTEASERKMRDTFGTNARISSSELSLRDIYLSLAKDKKLKRKSVNQAAIH